MAGIFSLVLVIVTLVTGIVWALEKLVWAKQRKAKVADIEANTNGLDATAIAKIQQQPWWIENSVSIFPVIGLVLILRSFIYEPFQIPSGSMMPTLLVGDFILVEKYAYGLKDPVWRTQLVETGKPERGDIAVFKYPEQPSIDYIKRVIGVPGDTIRYSSDKRLCVQPAGESECKILEYSNLKQYVYEGRKTNLGIRSETLFDNQHETLVAPGRNSAEGYFPRPGTNQWVVPKGHYFVMGDNRDNSADSRFWGFVPEGHLVGKAVGIWISFERERGPDSVLPSWIPTGVRFNRIGGIH